MSEMRQCKHHGYTEYRKYGAGFRCLKCSSRNVMNKRRQLKIMAVEYMGGKCQNCGYSKCIGALEFHHKNPSEKDFNITGSGATRSFDRMKPELDKCVLLCANCHREVHANVLSLSNSVG